MDQQCFDEWDQLKKKCNFTPGVPYGPAVVNQATRCAYVLALSGFHPHACALRLLLTNHVGSSQYYLDLFSHHRRISSAARAHFCAHWLVGVGIAIGVSPQVCRQVAPAR